MKTKDDSPASSSLLPLRTASTRLRPLHLANQTSTSATDSVASSGRKSLCFVVPFYNESSNLAKLLAVLDAFAASASRVWQLDTKVILVDDGSTDNGAAILAAVHPGTAPDLPVRILRLSRNFGKEIALVAGLRAADTDAIVMMDADLQHPIDLVPEFLRAWLFEGFDVAYARLDTKRDTRLIRRLLRSLYHCAVGLSSEIEIPSGAGDFRLMTRPAYEALRSLGERERSMKGLYGWIGFRQKGVPFTPDKRYSGDSKFGFLQLLGLAWNGITSFSVLPLRLSTITGVAVALAASSYGLWTIFEKLAFGADPPGYPTLVTLISFIGAAQLIFLGVVGEYIGKILLEAKSRPLYVLASDERLGTEERREVRPGQIDRSGSPQ